MARIRMLSEDLIGKIAAGEVVERPAAAIKELVENSLDAGARHVSVEILEGGIVSFRVTDDGCGIAKEDIRMAFERHATSKIRTEQDLDALFTLGFRGEALASIAAVSRVTLTTRTADRDTGIRVKNEGGQITDISEAACAPGTSILVKDIFYNVPVRRGFLKKPVTEANAITDLMAHLILSRPDVGFRYMNGSKLVYNSSGDGKMESAVLAVYGSQVARSLRKVDGHQGGILLRGFVGIGENARANRGGEYFFVNGRMLRSPLLSGSVEDACRERVMIGKYPICMLYLDMPPENVNVNVHPNKMEVRFRFDQQVREAVFSLVYDALQDRDAFQRPVEMTLTQPAADNAFPPAVGSHKEGMTPIPRRAEVTFGDTVPGIAMREQPTPVYRPIEGKRPLQAPAVPEAPDLLPPLQLQREESGTGSPVPRAAGTPGTGWAEMERMARPAKTDFSQPEKELEPDLFPEPEREETEAAGTETGQEGWRLSKENTNPEIAEQTESLTADLPQPMKIFGAVFNTFILIEYADHLLLVDQHAVHERLLFERMMKAWAEDRAGQELLVPYIVSVTGKEAALLEENRDLLESLGLSVEPFSASEVAVRSVPVTLGQNETADFLHEAIDALENGRIPGADKKRAAILQQACKHAVKGGEPLPEEVLRSLVEEMIEKKVTPTCPHGRPLVVAISHRELDRKFKRIQ